jgi:hypothetical protein
MGLVIVQNDDWFDAVGLNVYFDLAYEMLEVFFVSTLRTMKHRPSQTLAYRSKQCDPLTFRVDYYFNWLLW